MNQGTSIVGYRGYDLYGNRLTEKPTFEDYFTEKDENGFYKRLIAPSQPTINRVMVHGFHILAFCEISMVSSIPNIFFSNQGNSKV